MMQAAGVAKSANRERATREELNPLSSQGAHVIGSNPNEFATLIQNDIAKWRKVVASARVKPE